MNDRSMNVIAPEASVPSDINRAYLLPLDVHMLQHAMDYHHCEVYISVTKNEVMIWDVTVVHFAINSFRSRANFINNFRIQIRWEILV